VQLRGHKSNTGGLNSNSSSFAFIKARTRQNEWAPGAEDAEGKKRGRKEEENCNKSRKKDFLFFLISKK
jgi:hypothetical protein